MTYEAIDLSHCIYGHRSKKRTNCYQNRKYCSHVMGTKNAVDIVPEYDHSSNWRRNAKK